ncbi:Bug family tripartite tricarboxylate transporter substrate binding protein [Variovorax paradoxus]|uniref:Bug family tripartite tricarboxylate transporter substrate binding protein n=1 Tax=Variovorax paradoxus TaxID=34073 RepID=UPI003ED16AFE
MNSAKRLMAKGLLASLLASTVCADAAFAQAAPDTNFPTRPVKIIVSFPPGGFADVAGRALAHALQQVWKQPVVIDNRPGAAGIIAAQLTADAPADGHTLFLATDGPFVINPFVYKTLPYDPLKSFELVSLVAYTPLVLIANPNLVPSKNVQEFVSYAKAKAQGGKRLDYASSGTGGPHHLSMEEFKSAADIELNQIPYKGGAPALQDVISGQVPVMFAALAAVTPQAKAGRVRVLGSGGLKRSALAPEMPTIAEQGYPSFAAWSWAGLVAPRNTPKSVMAVLQRDIAKVLADPKYAELLAPSGAEPFGSGPADFLSFVTREQAKNSKLIKTLNIKLD